MKLPVDPCFPEQSEDGELLPGISAQAVRPIFIMGLHRSGTTFLYDCVARCFPVAQLSLYHLFYYQRLLTNFRDGLEARDRDRLNRCFASLGIKDRNIDSVPVNADEVEEYGFLLRQHSGRFDIAESNVELFREMCQKLLAVQPGSQGILLKNPWDTGNAERILRHFPDARFIYITREPISVLNSMLNALLTYLNGPQYYLELLLGRGKSRRGYRAGYAVWWGLRQFRRIVGESVVSRLFRPALARQLASQVARYRREVEALPGDRALEIDYQRLIADPMGTMQQLESFLGLPLMEPESTIEVRRRANSNSALAFYQARLAALIAKAEQRLG